MPTYPTYQSPIRTFQLLGVSTQSIDSTQLRMERKRLLLEIQISDTQTTMIGEQELSKNDVIELFDELEKVTHLDYHASIFNHSVLLDLLENSIVSGKVKEEHKIRFKTQEEWDEFIDFISPYLASSIDRLLSKVIRRNNFKDFEKIHPFFKLLRSTDAFFAFRKFSNFCETLEDRLEHLSYNSATFPANETAYLRYAPFYNSVNQLQTSYPNIADTVASAVVNFTVNCERKVGRDKYLVEISDQVKHVHCSKQLRSIITSNRTAFWNSREQRSNFNANGVWRVLVGIIIVGSMLIRYNACEKTSNRTYVSPQYEQLLEQIKEHRKNGYTDYSITTVSSGSSKMRGTEFLDLHEAVIESVAKSQYGVNHNISTGGPALVAPFAKDTLGPSYNLKNETASDMVMVIWSPSNLVSFYVPANSSIEFSAKNKSSIFFYSGKNWSETHTIEHWHHASSKNKFSLIKFNGYFSNTNDRDYEFTRKFFTLTDGESSNFSITSTKGDYQFYQGDRFVNFSY